MKQAERYRMLNEDERGDGEELSHLPYNQGSSSCRMFRYDQLNK